MAWHHGNADVRGLAVTGAEIVLLGDGRAYRSLRRGRGWTLSPAQLRVLPVLKQSGGYAAGGSLHIARFDLAAVRDACVAHGWRWHEPGHAPRSRAVRVRKAPAASPTPVLLRSAAEAARRRSLRHPLALVKFLLGLGALVAVVWAGWQVYAIATTGALQDLPKVMITAGVPALVVAAFAVRKQGGTPDSVTVDVDDGRLTWETSEGPAFIARESVGVVVVKGRDLVFTALDDGPSVTFGAFDGADRLVAVLRDRGWPIAA